jgi:cyclophilin family peptidyl-prolyl cis-trans isomerase
MSSKKYTAQKREEVKASKQKYSYSKILKPFLIIIVICVVILIVIFAGLPLLKNKPSDKTEVNNIPILKADYVVFNLNSTDNSIDVLANDEDKDGDMLNLINIGTPSKGSAEIVQNKVVYTPNANFTGVETFTYKVSDGEKVTSSTINIVVTNNHPIALIDTNKGMIVVELYNDKVPKTVENFINYANADFYNGLCFHRIKDDFMIQGGAYYPDRNYKQALYNPIDLEISSDLKHEDGSISMARTSDPNSATSQFFICDGPQQSLDDSYLQQYGQRGYAVFGKTIIGLDVVHNIAKMSHDNGNGDGSGWPIDNVVINNLIVENQ